MILYGVFVYARFGIDRELIAIYSTSQRARTLIDAQPSDLQMWMRLEDLVVDGDPSDEFWQKPTATAMAIAELEAQVYEIVRESGRLEGFDEKAWVKEWLARPNPALGGRRPEEMLQTEQGRRDLRELLPRQQSSVYA